MRGDGKTTRLMEQAVSVLSELPTTSRVFVTGAHHNHLMQLKQDFKHAGLVDVVFLDVNSILRGALRGQRGVLLIDDVWDLTQRERTALFKEEEFMERRALHPV